eukprot:TRINITY_DN19984_c0_g1_i1.p1 TRINITY_DN19984_c0_g1~~TRINITY_DN19984_c0_g1_i1.p1  ORF type:complete len:417 (-),score=62.39 TRINITY_DN19984_c0_g1_i1:87-1337(-)
MDKADNVNPGFAGFVNDFVDNFKGDFNSLFSVPGVLAVSSVLALVCVGGVRCREDKSDDEHGMSSVPLMHDIDDGPVRSFQTLRKFLFPRKVQWDRTRTSQMHTYSSIGVISALMLSTSMGKFHALPAGALQQFDVQLHGIIWCSATYAFFSAVVGAVALNVAYGQCRDDAQANMWTKQMGEVALHLPRTFTGFGCALFVLGTTHMFIVNFRSHGDHDSYDFSICAAFCYAALPISVIALGKIEHCINVLHRQEEQFITLPQLDYEDIDALFEDYVNSLKADQAHLDVNLEDFLQFALLRKIWRAGIYRGGPLQGLRATYAEKLVTAFHNLERASSQKRAESSALKNMRVRTRAIKQQLASGSALRMRMQVAREISVLPGEVPEPFEEGAEPDGEPHGAPESEPDSDVQLTDSEIM